MDIRQEVLYEIILDLHQSYDSLDRNLCLNILAVYVVGTQTLYLLRKYWVRPTMVVQAGGYFGTPLQGVSQGDPGGATNFQILQYGRRCGPPTLVHLGGINGGGS